MAQGKNAPTTVNLIIEFEDKLPAIIFADDPEREYLIDEIVECIKPLQVALTFRKNEVDAEIVDPITKLLLFIDDGRKILATLDITDNTWRDFSIMQDPPSGFAQSIEQGRQNQDEQNQDEQNQDDGH